MRGQTTVISPQVSGYVAAVPVKDFQNVKAGEVLETPKAKVVLGDKRIEMAPDQIGGWVRHRGWKLAVPPTARLVWPILPFNPYKNAPETDMRHAVGVLTVPVQVQPPKEGALNWRRDGCEVRAQTVNAL